MSSNLIYGMHPVMEALKSGQYIDKLFIQKNLKGGLSISLFEILKEKNINFKLVPIEKLNRLTKENHQGVVGYISPVKIFKLEDLLEEKSEFVNKIYILLDGVTDPRNFGAIIRTAAAVDATGIIIPENNSAPINEDVIKTSAGGIFKIPIAKVKHLKDAIFLLQSYGIKSIAATEKTDKLAYHTDLIGDYALIMGSEGKGIQYSILKLCDEKVKLPMSEHISSLNVSVACGIILYESVRQRIIIN